MIDDPNPDQGAGPRTRRIQRADTHVPTPSAAGGRTRTASSGEHDDATNSGQDRDGAGEDAQRAKRER